MLIRDMSKADLEEVYQIEKKVFKTHGVKLLIEAISNKTTFIL